MALELSAYRRRRKSCLSRHPQSLNDAAGRELFRFKERLTNMYGGRMAQLLGEDDFLDSPNGVDYSKLLQTFNNAKR